MVVRMKVANIEQELVIIPTCMKDDVSEASHVQLFIDIYYALSSTIVQLKKLLVLTCAIALLMEQFCKHGQ